MFDNNRKLLSNEVLKKILGIAFHRKWKCPERGDYKNEKIK
jgi:hypothetical protein